jgi:hypothetical protein
VPSTGPDSSPGVGWPQGRRAEAAAARLHLPEPGGGLRLVWNIAGRLLKALFVLSLGRSSWFWRFVRGHFDCDGIAVFGCWLVSGSGGERHSLVGLDVRIRQAARAFGVVDSESALGFGKESLFLIDRSGLACSGIASDGFERL